MSRIRAESLDELAFRSSDTVPTRTQKLEMVRLAIIELIEAEAISDDYIAIAGETLSGDRAVYIADDGLAYLSDKSATSCLRTIGVTVGAALIGAAVAIRTEGVFTEPTWAWAGNSVVWLASNGQLTQVPPTTGFLFQVGVPIGPTRLRIEPQLVAQLA